MNEAASSQDPPTSLLRRAVYLLSLGTLFFTTYNSANCHAASLPHVGSLVMAWEKRIPFLPWTIVPYWSIDLFYGASLIFASRRLELNRHALRLLCVQVLCVSCFVIFPLKFSFPKPPLTGLFAVWFDSLALFDKPFNQAPSLHIALLVILWAWFERRTHGLWRVLVHGWSLLIGLSVLTTYQHHFIDIPTGVLAGLLCVWLIPLEGPLPLAGIISRQQRPCWKLAGFYLAGAMGFAAIAFHCGLTGWWLGWSAIALGIVALAYLCRKPELLGKSGPRLRRSAWLLLLPYQIGAWLNSRLWTRRQAHPVEVAPGIWLGRIPGPHDRPWPVVIDLCAELPCLGKATHYQAFPCLDLVAPAPPILQAAAQAIETLRPHGDVLVCCALGYSRSASAVCTWLMLDQQAPTLEQAIRRVKSARPEIHLSPSHLANLAAACSAQNLP